MARAEARFKPADKILGLVGAAVAVGVFQDRDLVGAARALAAAARARGRTWCADSDRPRPASVRPAWDIADTESPTSGRDRRRSSSPAAAPSGSLANSCTSKPSATLKCLSASSGERAWARTPLAAVAKSKPSDQQHRRAAGRERLANALGRLHARSTPRRSDSRASAGEHRRESISAWSKRPTGRPRPGP